MANSDSHQSEIEQDWTVVLSRVDAGHVERQERRIDAASEDEAIGKALRAAGLHDGWDVQGWWPNQ